MVENGPENNNRRT